MGHATQVMQLTETRRSGPNGTNIQVVNVVAVGFPLASYVSV